MFKRSHNRAVLRIRIETVTPLLIRAGDAGLTPTAADLSCVRTHHAQHGSTVYIPGSSLKGVLRSAAEASIRGRTFHGVKGACDPLDHDKSCGKDPQKKMGSHRDSLPSHVVHQQQCLACRVFGSLRMKGRTGVRDLFPWSDTAGLDARFQPGGENHLRANRVEARNGVAIDRVTGSVKHGPFDQELVPAGICFFGDIALENYQAWQLGLLAQSFDEVNNGFAQLGSSKSRGLGVAKLTVDSILHEQAAVNKTTPMGVGMLADAQECKDYSLLPDVALANSAGVIHGLSRRFVVREEDAVRSWLDGGLSALGSLQ